MLTVHPGEHAPGATVDEKALTTSALVRALFTAVTAVNDDELDTEVGA